MIQCTKKCSSNVPGTQGMLFRSATQNEQCYPSDVSMRMPANDAMLAICAVLAEGLTQHPHWLEVPVIRSCQSPVWIWHVNYLHLRFHTYLIVPYLQNSQVFSICTTVSQTCLHGVRAHDRSVHPVL